jgi:hypothetical protein
MPARSVSLLLLPLCVCLIPYITASLSASTHNSHITRPTNPPIHLVPPTYRTPIVRLQRIAEYSCRRMTTGLVGPRPSSPSRKTLRSICLLREDLYSRLIPHLQSRSAVHRIRVSVSPPATICSSSSRCNSACALWRHVTGAETMRIPISNHAIEAGNFVRSLISGKYSRYRDDTRREKIWGMESVGDSSEPERKNARIATAKREHKSAQGQQPANSSKAAEKKYRQPRDECQRRRSQGRKVCSLTATLKLIPKVIKAIKRVAADLVANLHSSIG